MLSLIRCKSCGSYLAAARDTDNDVGTNLSSCPACGAPTQVPIENATRLTARDKVLRVIALLLSSAEAWFVVFLILAAVGWVSF